MIISFEEVISQSLEEIIEHITTETFEISNEQKNFLLQSEKEKDELLQSKSIILQSI